jgi:predicted transcriptional regulator of viral defense system
MVLRNSRPLVTVRSAAQALALEPVRAAKILARWAKQGRIKRLRRGVYAPVPLDSLSGETTLPNPWVLVPQLFAPGYVGGWSAAEHWHLTEQIFRDICVFTSRPFRQKRVVIEVTSFLLQRTEQDRLFGLATVWEGSVRILVSDPERTLVDMLDRPSVGGGIRHVESCLREYVHRPNSDLKKLVRYGERLRSGAVFKRLGYLLERSGPGNQEILKACRSHLTAGTAKLDPGLPADRLVTRWRLWISSSWSEKKP